MWHLAEEEAIFCGADCGRAEAGAVESACGGGDSQGGISEQTFYRWKKQYVGYGDGAGATDETTPGREQPIETTGCRSEFG